MKNLLFFLFGLLCLSHKSNSQTTPNWDWGADYSGSVISSCYHNNYLYVIGNYYTPTTQIGSTLLTNGGGFDTYIAKWDTLGNFIWATSISDTGSQTGVAIHVNSNNELVIAGNNTNPNLVLGSDTITAGTTNGAFIAKYDLNGNILDAFGVAANTISDFCNDGINNIYATTSSGILKYSNAGMLVWQKPIYINQIRYSSIGSKLKGIGSFMDTLTIGGTTIIAGYSATWGSETDLYCVQLDLNGNLDWLTQVTNTVRLDMTRASYIQESTGDLFLPVMTFGLGGMYTTINKVSNVGIVTNVPFSNVASGVVLPSSFSFDYPEILNISGKDSFLSFCLVSNNYPYSTSALGIFNLNLQETILSLNCSSDYHYFNGSNSIYMSGSAGSIYHNFGKLGNSALTSSITHTIMNKCVGTTVSLSGNISGGVPPLTYSWSPSTGLSSTSTNSVSLVATSNISYTLTVTDANSQVVKDTFDIIIDTPFSPLVITPQYPGFCHDSMYLYSNLGVNVTWYKYNGSSWNVNYPQYFNQQTIVYSPGIYQASISNTCGTANDTIEIQQAVNVIANASSTDICLGQSATLSGSGALTYVWTGGVINNNAFNPTSTHTYTVTGTDINGCIDTASVQIEVHPIPTLGSLSATPSSICAGGNSTLSCIQPINYCTPLVYYSGTTGQCITNVNFGSGLINNTTGDGPGDYNYYTATNANVIAGVIYPISISRNLSGTIAGGRSVWIDFNHDGTFDDVNEKVFAKDTNAVAVVGNITIPITAFNGKTRMRVAGKWSGNFTPCNIDTYGEFEDYNITISGGVNNIQWTPSSSLSSAYGAQVQANNILTTTTYTATVTSSFGCSNSGTVTLTVNPTSASTTNTTICSTSLPYLWNTQSLISSGTYTATFTNAFGCDSIATLNLTVKPASASTTNVSVCSISLPYIWNAQTYTTSGVYAATFINAVGCDSISILNLTVNFASASTTNTIICSNGLPYLWNSQSLTASGTYSANLLNALGCDSIATLNLTVNPTSSSTTDVTICSTSLPYVWNSQSLTASGMYTATFTNSLGCDSIATLNLTVNPTSASTTNTTICSTSLPYVWNTQSLTASGTYTSNFTNALGCDSIATLNLTVNPTSASITNTTVCSTSLPYVWNMQSLTASGTYTSNFTNALGCDSIATLNLTVNPTSASTTNSTICSTSLPYVWNTQSLTSSGTYTANFTNALGCDSIASLNLTVNPTSASTTNSTICSTSLPYVWNTQSITASGTYTSNFTNSLGCDSIATLNLTVNPTSASTTNSTICSTSLPYVWNTQSLTSSGTYTANFTNALGCDSTASLNLTVNPTSVSTTDVSICSTSLPYVWNTQSLTASGTYTANFTNSYGCDSIASLNLIVNPLPIVAITPFTDSTICIGTSYVLHVDSSYSAYTWTWNGNIVSSNDSVLVDSSGTYIVSCTDTNGCFALDTVNVNILPSPQPTIVQNNYTLTCTNTSNVNYQWYFNGTAIGTNDSLLTITQDGQYIVKITDSAGCIGFDTLIVIGLGIHGISTNENISIYPNPSSGFINIEYELNESGICTIQLIDASGRVVADLMRNQKINQGKIKQTYNLNKYKLADGIYLLNGNFNGIRWTKRVQYSH